MRSSNARSRLPARQDGSSDFLVIARTEALIAGLGQAEALRCAQAYVQLGGDMIRFIRKRIGRRSKAPRAWSGSVPLVIVPNAYPDLDAERVKAFRNIRMVI
ncbi:hypothetical protein [Bradyrhizobium sp. STM 3562]|uniref:hypothetical protein n=1 Tax=Bradyrhizobium sp. STM 3562 TaxID=578924 RepID=UPI0038901461